MVVLSITVVDHEGSWHVGGYGCVINHNSGLGRWVGYGHIINHNSGRTWQVGGYSCVDRYYN